MRARILLGFVASAAGDHAGAIEHLDARDRLRARHARLAARRLRDARARLRLGRLAEPGRRRCSSEALDGAGARSSPSNRAAEVRYATYLSYALTDLGERRAARAAVLAEVLVALRSRPTTAYTRIRLYWSLGRVALEEAKPLAALDNFRRAIALLEATEDALHLARAHLACAEAAMSAGEELAGARSHLEEAERLLGARPAARRPGGAPPAAGAARRCGPATRRERRAPRPSRRSSSRSGIPSEQGRAWSALAEARAARGDPRRRRRLRRARSRCCASTEPVASTPSVLRAYGRYLRDAGREREALEVFERAAEVAASLQASPPAGANRWRGPAGHAG